MELGFSTMGYSPFKSCSDSFAEQTKCILPFLYGEVEFLAHKRQHAAEPN